MPDPIPNAPADEELSASDIADLAGVSPSAVSNWRKRYVDFPEPIGSAGRWVRFRSEEVLGWLAANDKLPVAVGPSTELTSIDDVLWEAVNRTRTTHDPLESLAVAGAFAATLVKPGPNWEEEHEEVIAGLSDLIGQELRAIEGTDELYSNLILANQEGGYQEIADAVLKVADRIGTSTRNNEGTTPPEVADFIAAAVAPSLGKHIDMDEAREAWENHYWVARSFYDPCAGVGRTLLRAAQEHDDGDWPIHVSFFGQEINPDAARVASLVNRLKNPTEETDIVVGNSLQQDHFPDRKADLVVAHLPFGLRLPDELGDDPRWILGNPGRDGSSAWIQIALSKLSERGRAAVVVEPSWAFRGGPSRELRAALVRQNLLDGVIALPRGTFLPDTNSGGLLVLLAKDRSNREPAREPGEVLFVDWSYATRPVDGSGIDPSVWKHCFANWRDLGRQFATLDDPEVWIDAWEELQGELAAATSGRVMGLGLEFSRRYEGQPEIQFPILLNFSSQVFCTSEVAYEEIADNDFDLTPKRYMVLQPALTPGEVVESFEEESNRAALIAREATAAAKATVAAMQPLAAFYTGQQPDQAPTMRLTTLGDLQTAGQIEIIAGRGTGRTTDTAATEDTPQMLTSSWIREKASGKTPETQTLVTKSAKIPQDSLVKPGDVIFTTTAGSDSGQTAVWTATEAELGAALGFGLYAIRVNVDGGEPPELTPDFVAAWCRTGHLSHQVQRLSTGDVLPKLRWRDLQRIEIPVPADAAAHDWFTKQMGLHADLRTSHKELSRLVENLSTSESRFFDSLIASTQIAEDELFGL